MRTFKKFGVLAVAVFALSAVGVASASAAEFTASATGTLVGHATEKQIFKTNGGEVICEKAATEGPIEKTASLDQHATVTYSICTAFGLSVDISKATYTFTSSGKVHVTNTISITPTIFGVSACTTTVGPQELGTVDYANSGTNNVKVTPTVTGITYTSSGGACGASGSNGTYKGANEVERQGGGTIRFDP